MMFAMAAMPAFASETSASGSADAAEDAVLFSDSAVSGGDVSPADASVFAGVPLRSYVFDDYGVSLSLPDDGSYVTINSNESDIMGTVGVGTESLLESGYLVYPATYDKVMFSLTFTESNYSLSIGDFKKLPAEKKQDMINATNANNLSAGDFSDVRFITVNGHDYFVNNNFYDYYGVYQYTYDTIVDGVKYQFQAVSYSKLSDADFRYIEDNIVNSIKINKVSFSGGVASGLSTLEKIALAAVALLLVVVGFLTFFIIRFNAFSKAAGSSFNIIGFNMPPKSYDDDDIDDEDDDE